MEFSLANLLNLSTAVFMAGNLLAVGLTLRIGETFAGLRDFRFVGWGLFWGFTGSLFTAVWTGTRGVPAEHRSVLALGVGTRNLGVPFAVLSSVPRPDPGTIAVIALAVPVTIVEAVVAAACFAKGIPRS